MWRVAANTCILNKQSRRADNVWPCSLGLGEMLTTPQRKNYHVRNHSKPLGRTWSRWENNNMDLYKEGCGGIDGMELAQVRGRWRVLVVVVMNLRFP